MLEQLKRAAFILLIGLVVVLLLAVMSDYASGGETTLNAAACLQGRAGTGRTGSRGFESHSVVRSHGAAACDYMVSRGTTINSERPIGLLILEAGIGVLNDARIWQGREASSEQKIEALVSGGKAVSTTLKVDGREQRGKTSFLAAWRLAGFLLWDADGRIERTTSLKFRGRDVGIVDRVENGRVWVRVVVGPPLGDPHVRFAVLTLEANEHVRVQNESTLRSWFGANSTLVLLSCSAVIDLPFDGRRDRVHSRRERWGCDRPTWSEGKGETKAGPELATRVDDLESAGRLAVDAGQRQIRAVIAEFLERTCR